MATRKKRQKYIRQVSPADLVKLAEDELRRGQVEEAIRNLTLAEKELKPRVRPDGKKITIPPHLAAAQTSLAPLMARALAAHALASLAPEQRLADFEEAARYAPDDTRYLLALGACRLLMGEAEAAYSHFQKADDAHPGDALVTRAFALGLLATGRAKEAGELIGQTLRERSDGAWRRLAAIHGLTNGGGANAQGDRLLSGLSHLAAGEAERAREQLDALPMPDHNPSRAEAARMATQLFYSGAIGFNARRYQAAAGDWREAQRLAQEHKLDLPWLDRLIAYYHKIAELTIQEDPALAVECWREALKTAPDDKAALANLVAVKRSQGLHAWNAGDIRLAAQIWLEALQNSPQDEQLLRCVAIACEKQNHKTEAVTHWRALARVWRRQVKSRASEAGFKDRLLRLEQHLVTLMLETGHDDQEIISELEAALKFDPENQKLRLQAAERLMEAGKSKQALKHLDEAEKQHGLSVELLIRRGIAVDMLGRHAEARKTFERAMHLDPASAQARRFFLLFLGQEVARASERGDAQRAMKLCEEQLALDPNFDQPMIRLASLYLKLGRKAEAKKMVERFLGADPDSPQKRVEAGDVYLDHGMKKEAETLFKKAIELDPSADCFTAIGISYLEANDLKKAINHFDLAAKTASVEMLIAIAMALTEEQRTRDAERFLNIAIERDPDHPMPHLLKGLFATFNPILLLLDPKRLNEAIKELAEAERLMTGKAEYEGILSEVRAARRFLEQGPSALLGSDNPFLFDDDDDDDDEPFFPDFPPSSVRKKKKRGRK
ncbi:MAG: tetratricopeptide repeat protein [Acidobacteria bacterium]|nr:tetratricopeptide repeat protein [Acidobacteriota bacterium]